MNTYSVSENYFKRMRVLHIWTYKIILANSYLFYHKVTSLGGYSKLNRNDRVEFRRLSPAELDTLQDEVRQLQAQATRDGLLAIAAGIAWLGRQLWSGLRHVTTSFGEAQAARRAYQELSRLSDRELADMGLTRSNIPAVVAGIFHREADSAFSTNREVVRVTPAQDNAMTPAQDNMEQRYREAA